MKKPILVIVLALLGLALTASAALVNVSPGTIAAVSQSTSYGGGAYPAQNALNRNYGDFTHTDGEATDNWWLLDLGTAVPIDHVIVYNRGGGCCQHRLRDITISLYDANNTLLVDSPLLNPDNVLGGGGLELQAPGPATLGYTNPVPLFARYVKVTRKATGPAGSHDYNVLSMGEVEIYGNNVAQGRTVANSSDWPGFAAANAADGNPFTYSHTFNTPIPCWWEVDLGGNFDISTILMLNRYDCCLPRLRDITVEILDETLTPVYTSPLLNPANALNGPPSVGVDLSGGVVRGRYVRVTRTPDGGGDDNIVLALGEVQVFGTVPPGVPPTITRQPQSQVLEMGGGTVRFTVEATGTEPLSYYWYKNGELLPDQTSTLTLNNVGFDAIGTYSVVVANGIDVVPSDPAQLQFFFVNVARAGVATQSTEDNGGAPSRAIDGNTDGNWGNSSVTHTGNAPIDNEWWEVDLGAPKTIDVIHVWFRTDCCAERNENLRLVVYDDPAARNVVWTQDVGTTPGSSKSFAVPHITGQAVRVEHIPTTGAVVLSLAEVQVGAGDPNSVELLWVGGNPDNTWDLGTTANWDPGVVFMDRDSVTFDNSSIVNSVSLAGTLSPLYVNVNADADYSFEGTGQIVGFKLNKSGSGTLTLANSADNSFLGGMVVNDSTLVLNPGADAALGGAISGNGTVRKEGVSMAALSGSSSYTGGTVVNGGTLQVRNNRALGDPVASPSITVSDGASLDLTSSELFDYAQPIVISGVGYNGAGALTKSALGNQNGMAIRSLTLGTDATIGGVANARIDIGRGDWVYPPEPSAAIHLDGQGHTLSLVGGIYLGILAGAQNLPEIILNAGTLVAPHNNNSLGEATITLNGGTLSPWGPDHIFPNPLNINSGFIDNQGFHHTYYGPVQVNGPVQVSALFPGNGGGGNITFNGNISGTGTITKVGGYTVLLGANNGGFAGTYDNEESNTFFTSDTAGSAQANWVLNNGNLACYMAGNRTIQLGSLRGSGGTIGNNLASPAEGQATFAIGAIGDYTTFAGQIIDTFYQAGTVAITKTGLGVLTLTGNNTYTGPTTVSQGTLEVTTINSLGGASRSVEIAAGALLTLSFSDTLLVDQLTFDGVPQALGTWGASGSGATYIDDTHFQGSGVLLVVGAPEIAPGGFTVSSPGAPGGTAAINFDTLTGYQYRVLYTDSLPATSWTPLDPGWQNGTGSPMMVPDNAATVPQRFYRVERLRLP